MTEQQMSPPEMFDKYFGPALFTPWAGVLLDFARPRSKERVLDVACGTGTVARLVAPLVGAEGKVVALDINPGMLGVARAKPAPDGAAIEWREGDAMALDLPDRSFDLVLCQQGMQFFPDREAAAREMRRVLVEGGRAVLNVWQGPDRHPLYEALGKAEANYLGIPVAEVVSPFGFPDPDELRALLEGAGFGKVEVVSKSLDVYFPEPERFVYLTLFGAAAFLPDFDWNDEAVRSRLIDTVTREIEPVVARYRNGDRLTFPMHANVAVAHT